MTMLTWPNKITGANAGGLRQLPMRTRWGRSMPTPLPMSSTPFQKANWTPGSLKLLATVAERKTTGEKPSSYTKKRCQEIGCARSVVEDAERGCAQGLQAGVIRLPNATLKRKDPPRT